MSIGFGQDVVVAVGTRRHINVEFEAAVVVQHPFMVKGVGIQGGGHDEDNQAQAFVLLCFDEGRWCRCRYGVFLFLLWLHENQ